MWSNTKLFIIFLYCSPLFIHAQPGALDLSFDPGTGANGEIRTISIQADGKIFIAGKFTSYNGTAINRLARLHPDGALDTAFLTGTGANRSILTSAVQPDGKIIIGGNFTTYDSAPYNRILRLNTDGSADTTFDAGSGFDDDVAVISIQTDGRILAGGKFTTFNGIACPNLVRLNADGSKDNSFSMGTGPNGTVEDIAIQPSDDKIVIAGDFTFYGLTPALRVGRLNTNGSYDAGFNSATGASSVIYAVAVQEDGKIIIGGNFTTYSFQSRVRIAQLHPDGTIDGGFDPVLGSSGEVLDILIESGPPNGFPDNFLIGGNFISYNGAPMSRIARVHPWGLRDIVFNPGAGVDGAIIDMAMQEDGRVLIAGNFTAYDGTSRNRIARIYDCEPSIPDVITGNDSTMCPGEVLIYSVPQSADAESYIWTLPDGWTGSSDSASITAISNGQGGEISVSAFNDSCGYSVPRVKTIYRIQPPAVPICLVTVDTASTHNILLWEKPSDKSLIDSFIIYREITTGLYSRIAAFHRDSLSEYHDYSANPNSTSYRYKLSVLDICGVESALSNFHHTIHLQNLGSGNFQWTFYEVENSSNPVTSFNVYRDNLGNGNFQQIGLIPGTNSTFTDVNYFAFPDANYVVDVNWSISCTPQRGTVNTTRSNIRGARKTDTVGVESLLAQWIEIFPNPAEQTLTVHLARQVKITRLRLLNSVGEIVWGKEFNSWNQNTINVGVATLPKGMYLLLIETGDEMIGRKVLVGNK